MGDVYDEGIASPIKAELAGSGFRHLFVCQTE